MSVPATFPPPVQFSPSLDLEGVTPEGCNGVQPERSLDFDRLVADPDSFVLVAKPKKGRQLLGNNIRQSSLFFDFLCGCELPGLFPDLTIPGTDGEEISEDWVDLAADIFRSTNPTPRKSIRPDDQAWVRVGRFTSLVYLPWYGRPRMVATSKLTKEAAAKTEIVPWIEAYWFYRLYIQRQAVTDAEKKAAEDEFWAGVASAAEDTMGSYVFNVLWFLQPDCHCPKPFFNPSYPGLAVTDEEIEYYRGVTGLSIPNVLADHLETLRYDYTKAAQYNFYECYDDDDDVDDDEYDYGNDYDNEYDYACDDGNDNVVEDNDREEENVKPPDEDFEAWAAYWHDALARQKVERIKAELEAERRADEHWKTLSWHEKVTLAAQDCPDPKQRTQFTRGRGFCVDTSNKRPYRREPDRATRQSKVATTLKLPSPIVAVL